MTLRLFGFLFSSPDRLLHFARERAKLCPDIALLAKAGKPKYYACPPSEQEVRSATKALKNGKACGIDQIHAEML